MVKNPNIIVGDFTYFSDDCAAEDFDRHVTHHYDFYGDKLIIGRFCQIGKGLKIVMNGANHQRNCVSTYPFYIFQGWNQTPPTMENLAPKGDSIIGNDVWIGENVTIMAGVKIGDGAIIGMNSTATKDVESYSIVGGNPARIIRKRFDDELIDLMLRFRWWDREIEEIDRLIPLLSSPDLEAVKKELKETLAIL